MIALLLAFMLQAPSSCQAAHPDTDVCLIILVSDKDSKKPIEHVNVEAGRDSKMTDKDGTIRVDIPKGTNLSIRALAPPGYKVDPGRTITVIDKGGVVPIVLEKR